MRDFLRAFTVKGEQFPIQIYVPFYSHTRRHMHASFTSDIFTLLALAAYYRKQISRVLRTTPMEKRENVQTPPADCDEG